MNKNDIAIKVENISKLYRIGSKVNLHDSFGGAIFNFIKSPIENYRKYRSLYKFDDLNPEMCHSSNNDAADVIWAVRDVSFELRKGVTLGIIGRNGAGKSTLLKILCRIVNPTHGRAEISGRVSSILEVGTGFHQELTGRENIYLNGTILGMTKKEIDGKFDQIVSFSGVEKFIDTPVKRYSSGMKVRLAFSVAAHIEPEILIVDEVLAVGDAEFQKKCLARMQDVGKEGRTVLFVSHNMSAVTRLCQRAILLDGGRVIDDGLSHHVVNRHLNPEKKLAMMAEWRDISSAPGDHVVRLLGLRVRTEDGQLSDRIDVRQSASIEMKYQVLKSGYRLVPYFFFFNPQGEILFGTLEHDLAWKPRRREIGLYTSTVLIPGNFLSPGLTTVNSFMMSIEPDIQHFRLPDSLTLEIVDSFDGDSARGYFKGEWKGAVRPLFKWKTVFHDETFQAKQRGYETRNLGNHHVT